MKFNSQYQIQAIFTFKLDKKYTDKFISLHLDKGVPLDVITNIAAYYISSGQDNPLYIKSNKHMVL